MIFLFQGCILRFHVNLPGCIYKYQCDHQPTTNTSDRGWPRPFGSRSCMAAIGSSGSAHPRKSPDHHQTSHWVFPTKCTMTFAKHKNHEQRWKNLEKTMKKPWNTHETPWNLNIFRKTMEHTSNSSLICLPWWDRRKLHCHAEQVLTISKSVLSIMQAMRGLIV